AFAGSVSYRGWRDHCATKVAEGWGGFPTLCLVTPFTPDGMMAASVSFGSTDMSAIPPSTGSRRLAATLLFVLAALPLTTFGGLRELGEPRSEEHTSELQSRENLV